MEDDLKTNLTAKTTWTRGLYMLLFVIVFNIAEILIAAVVIFQFISTLISGKNNNRLLKFGRSLSTFVYQVLQYVTYNSEEKPYPFGPWPSGRTDKKQSAQSLTESEPGSNE